MGAAVSLRADFDAEGLRRLARQSKHAAQARRLLADFVDLVAKFIAIAAPKPRLHQATAGFIGLGR
jgi:hypothetical protein